MASLNAVELTIHAYDSVCRKHIAFLVDMTDAATLCARVDMWHTVLGVAASLASASWCVLAVYAPTMLPAWTTIAFLMLTGFSADLFRSRDENKSLSKRLEKRLSAYVEGIEGRGFLDDDHADAVVAYRQISVVSDTVFDTADIPKGPCWMAWLSFAGIAALNATSEIPVELKRTLAAWIVATVSAVSVNRLIQIGIAHYLHRLLGSCPTVHEYMNPKEAFEQCERETCH